MSAGPGVLLRSRGAFYSTAVLGESAVRRGLSAQICTDVPAAPKAFGGGGMSMGQMITLCVIDL